MEKEKKLTVRQQKTKDYIDSFPNTYRAIANHKGEMYVIEGSKNLYVVDESGCFVNSITRRWLNPFFPVNYVSSFRAHKASGDEIVSYIDKVAKGEITKENS